MVFFSHSLRLAELPFLGPPLVTPSLRIPFFPVLPFLGAFDFVDSGLLASLVIPVKLPESSKADNSLAFSEPPVLALSFTSVRRIFLPLPEVIF